MHTGVAVAEAHHPGVVGGGDRRLAELERLEEEDPLLARVLVAHFGRRGHARELLLRRPEHLAEDAILASLLVCELPGVEERAEVGGGADEEVEVRVILHVMQSGECERDDHRVRVIVGGAFGGESGGDLRDAFRRADQLDLHDAGRDCGGERARLAGVGTTVVRDAGVSQRVQGTAENGALAHRYPCLRGRQTVEQVGRRGRTIGLGQVSDREQSPAPDERGEGRIIQPSLDRPLVFHARCTGGLHLRAPRTQNPRSPRRAGVAVTMTLRG
jgi:hypothetical protein